MNPEPLGLRPGPLYSTPSGSRVPSTVNSQRFIAYSCLAVLADPGFRSPVRCLPVSHFVTDRCSIPSGLTFPVEPRTPWFAPRALVFDPLRVARTHHRDTRSLPAARSPCLLCFFLFCAMTQTAWSFSTPGGHPLEATPQGWNSSARGANPGGRESPLNPNPEGVEHSPLRAGGWSSTGLAVLFPPTELTPPW